jgi:phospholipid/cholesterol/gamma-HCH transport system substrate-binding protein
VRSRGALTRVVALAAVLAAAVVAIVVLLGGAGGGYSVRAHFQNASQLVKGNLVQVSGKPVGKVTGIDLTEDGQAAITMSIDGDYAPLRRGTLATVRQASLSGVANRYIDLRLAPQGAEQIADGGIIESDQTTTAVDLDQLFNTFDPETRTSLTKVIRGSAEQYADRGTQMNAGLMYLNPSLQASSRLFRELNRDTELFERFIVSSSKLVTDVADRREDLAGVVDNLATTLSAVGDEKRSLADAIAAAPNFMRRANTTFVNLRATLDDLDPLIDDSKPVAKKLRPFLAELRPLARDARPTLRDLQRLIRQPGDNNDLVDLNRLQPLLRDVAIRDMEANGKRREGAFPASAKALRGTTPELGYLRPYTPDLFGWFDDFSHSGVYDALGGVSRVAPHAPASIIVEGASQGLVPPELRDMVFRQFAATDQRNRCPGGAEHVPDDKSAPFRDSPDHNCDPSQVLPGP